MNTDMKNVISWYNNDTIVRSHMIKWNTHRYIVKIILSDTPFEYLVKEMQRMHIIMWIIKPK